MHPVSAPVVRGAEDDEKENFNILATTKSFESVALESDEAPSTPISAVKNKPRSSIIDLTEDSDEGSAATMTAAVKNVEQQEPQRQHLQFDSYADLSTRLVLLPRVEEEGIGAIVASLIKSNNHHQDPAESAKEEKIQTHSALNSSHSKEDFAGLSVVSVQCGDDQSPSSSSSNNNNNNSNNKHDYTQEEFSDILAAIRQCGQHSITLVLERIEHNDDSSADGDESTNDQQAEEATNTSAITGMRALSAWGSRMRAQSEKLADQATKAAQVAKERAQQQLSTVTLDMPATGNNDLSTSNNNIDTERDPSIYIQSSLGAYFLIDPKTNKNSNKLTTASTLVARISATEPCPRHYRFQWYRSSCGTPSIALPLTALHDQCPSDASSVASSTVATQPSATGHHMWVPLKGATNPGLQPNASLIGYQLRCIITIPSIDSSDTSLASQNHDGDDSASDESDLEDDCSTSSTAPRKVICDELPKVCADPTLFNASRQALARGAKFGGIKGRGNAVGRTFSLEIKMAAHPTRRGHPRLSANAGGVVASVMIAQVASNQAEPLSKKPLLQAAANADPVVAKNLDLVLPLIKADGSGTFPDTEMLQALCTDGVFQLEAPNRMTRESILMAIGIANFRGKPSQLDACTILFPELSNVVPKVAAGKSLLDDEASFLTASSAASSSIPATPSTPPKSIHATSRSLPTTPTGKGVGTFGSIDAQNRARQMEEELAFLRLKLARKDKIVSELQRKLTTTDAAWGQTKRELISCQSELQKSQAEASKLSLENQQYRNKEQCHQADLTRRQAEQDMQVSELRHTVMEQATELTAAKKQQKSIQNDKAVLQAAVEAREAKLAKMQTLQSSFRALEEKVGKHEHLKKDLERSQERYEQMQKDLERVLQLETSVREELHLAQKTVDQLNERLESADKETKLAKEELKTLKDKHHTLKMERNTYKAKGDSLSKEVSRLCKNGRTLKDVDKIIADEEARKEEVDSLRKQKRQALEDAHTYRTSYEQSRIVTQQLHYANTDTHKAVERNAELERVLADMTEYVNAKEMQLETMKLVNEALQDEIHMLAKASMTKNDV